MKNTKGKSKAKSTNIPRKLTINKVDVYIKPEMLSITFYRYWSETGQSNTKIA